jgi:hypothetical protein
MPGRATAPGRLNRMAIWSDQDGLLAPHNLRGTLMWAVLRAPIRMSAGRLGSPQDETLPVPHQVARSER